MDNWQKPDNFLKSEDSKAPVFVKFEAYKDIMDITMLMREKVKQAKFLLDKLADLKAQEDAQLASWAKELESVESSIASIEKSLSNEAGR